MNRGSWTRRACSGALGVLVTLVMLTGPASADAPANAKPKTAALLFAVQGTGGAYTTTDTGAAALTLTGVDQQATWFTDRPDRQAGTAAIDAALRMIGFGDDPPNAVLTVSGADAEHDALAVKLDKPRYDTDGATLTFDVTTLDTPGGGLRAYRPRLDNSVGDSFGAFSLFIDDTDTPVNGDGTPEAPQPNTVSLYFQVFLDTSIPSTTRVKVTPLWDAWNNCILDNPFPGSYDGTNAWNIPRIDASKNQTGSCFFEQSRMHWRVEAPDLGFAEEVQMHGENDVTCIDLQGQDKWNVVCKDGEDQKKFTDLGPAFVNVSPR